VTENNSGKGKLAGEIHNNEITGSLCIISKTRRTSEKDNQQGVKPVGE